MKLTGKRSSLEKIADIGDIIQKSSSEVGLQMAGLGFITKLLEEEPGHARQVIKADGGLTVRSVVLIFLLMQELQHGMASFSSIGLLENKGMFLWVGKQDMS